MKRIALIKIVFKNKLAFALIAILAVFSPQCEKPLEENPTSLLTNKVFYQTPNDALLAVNAAYDHLGSGSNNSDFGGVYFNNYWAVQALASDNGNSGRPEPNAVQLAEFRHDASNLMVQDIWEDIYRTINLANLAIANIPGIEMDESLKSRFLGEVHFIRGLMYFELVRMFGDVPLLTVPTEDLSILTISRTPVEEVYAQLISDLQMAEATLPVRYSGADIGRATTGAASGYLARVHLTREEWSLAQQQAEKVMALGVYRLLPDFADVFKIANNNSDEVVFATNFTLNNDAIWETSQFNVRALPLALNRNSNSWEVPTLDVYNIFDDLDRRKEVTFATSFTESDGTVLEFPPHIFKYWDQQAEPSASSGGNDFFNLRYSDILLMYAEASNESNGGPSAEAYEAINRVRRRARFAEGEERNTLPDLSGLDQAGFREQVWLERRKEFVWEGQRWFDLVRQERLKTRVEAAKSGISVDENKYKLFGIPQRERDINPNLSQNPGY
ncbi:MAG: RagB/SusD family nutrient uptake outer membrane protein [Saprospiraceae bacterium]|nr:RagB/SusD family nutrient uptake outer membrane protein [Saprospiraceae bacterium]